MQKAKKIIELLLDSLPDSHVNNDDTTWLFCWEELSDEAQQIVINARQSATDFLTSLEEQERNKSNDNNNL
jgi:hypothetical protein